MMGQSLGEKQRVHPHAGRAQERLRVIGKLRARTVEQASKASLALMRATRAVQDDHLRQRNGVPRLRADRSGERGEILLRHAAP